MVQKTESFLFHPSPIFNLLLANDLFLGRRLIYCPIPLILININNIAWFNIKSFSLLMPQYNRDTTARNIDLVDTCIHCI